MYNRKKNYGGLEMLTETIEEGNWEGYHISMLKGKKLWIKQETERSVMYWKPPRREHEAGKKSTKL
jgi:hypothetical protein